MRDTTDRGKAERGTRPTVLTHCNVCGRDDALCSMKMRKGKLKIERPCRACRGKTRREWLRVKRGLPEDAVLDYKRTSDMPKLCHGCGLLLPIERFDAYTEKRGGTAVQRRRALCHDCDLERRRANERRHLDTRGWKKKKHACRVCGEEVADKAGRRCRPCYLKETAAHRAEYARTHPQDKRRKPEKERENPYVAKLSDPRITLPRQVVRKPGLVYMEIALDEVWVVPCKCERCKKPILFRGRCYACATGRDRIVVRTEERQNRPRNKVTGRREPLEASA